MAHAHAWSRREEMAERCRGGKIGKPIFPANPSFCLPEIPEKQGQKSRKAFRIISNFQILFFGHDQTASNPVKPVCGVTMSDKSTQTL